MPLFKTINASGGIIGIWRMTESADELIPNFTSEELNDPSFQKYSHEKRRVEWMSTRHLIKQLIGSDFSISYSNAGKPILNHDTFNYISISHSRDFAAVFIHKELEVGLDIESTTRNYNPIAKRYLSDSEMVDVNKDTLLQCLYWCAKEAIFKLVPDEGVEFREQIHIKRFDPRLEDQFTAQYTHANNKSHYRLHFQIFDDHGLVWVTEAVEMNEIDL